MAIGWTKIVRQRSCFDLCSCLVLCAVVNTLNHRNKWLFHAVTSALTILLYRDTCMIERTYRFIMLSRRTSTLSQRHSYRAKTAYQQRGDFEIVRRQMARRYLVSHSLWVSNKLGKIIVTFVYFSSDWYGLFYLISKYLIEIVGRYIYWPTKKIVPLSFIGFIEKEKIFLKTWRKFKMFSRIKESHFWSL